MPIYKWISFHIANTLWYIDAGQRFALVKRQFSNARHAVWYVDAGQGIALVKRRVSDACHTVRNVDACQRCTIGKCLIANYFRAFLYHIVTR